MVNRKNRRKNTYVVRKRELAAVIEILLQYADHSCVDDKPDFVTQLTDENTGQTHWMKIVITQKENKQLLTNTQKAECISQLPFVCLRLIDYDSRMNPWKTVYSALLHPVWSKDKSGWATVSGRQTFVSLDQIVETHISYVVERDKIQWIEIIKTVFADISDLANLVTLFLTPPPFVRRQKSYPLDVILAF
jgi:hypothetical protein